ncbi:MAG: hypothetical protein OQK78_04715 [Gammaproteobacteria bacterium]|nr:hypothetical protein [Gammaproteobacteria bacterium]
MPLKNEYLKTGIIIWHWGVVTGDELISSNREIYNHKFENGCKFQLAELSKVTDFSLTTKDIKALANMDQSLTTEQPQVGVVVAQSDYIFGMSRMWSMLAETETFKTHVVRTIDDALDYLRENGIDIEKPEFPQAELR